MIRRKDLVGIGDKDYKTRQNEFMQCQNCGEDFHGTQGDFFTIHMDYLLYCPECGSDNIALVKNVTTTVILKQ